jgi:galactokinase
METVNESCLRLMLVCVGDFQVRRSARMTGGGFGGSAIALTPVGSEQQVRAAVEGAFFRTGHAAPGIFSVRPAAGAGRLA